MNFIRKVAATPGCCFAMRIQAELREEMLTLWPPITDTTPQRPRR